MRRQPFAVEPKGRLGSYMSWESVSKHHYHLGREAIDSHTQSTPRNLPVDGPQVCLLYESEAEREELSRRLREVKLDELPWELIDVRPAPKPHSLGRITDALVAGSAAPLAIVRSHWALATALGLSLPSALLVLRLIREPNPAGIAATG